MGGQSEESRGAFRFQRRWWGRAAVLTVHGELDVAAAPVLRQALSEDVSSNTPVVVDLAELTFIDSSGLGVLASTAKLLRDRSRAFVLCRIPTCVENLLEITQVGAVLDERSSLADAVAVANASVTEGEPVGPR